MHLTYWREVGVGLGGREQKQGGKEEGSHNLKIAS